MGEENHSSACLIYPPMPMESRPQETSSSNWLVALSVACLLVLALVSLAWWLQASPLPPSASPIESSPLHVVQVGDVTVEIMKIIHDDIATHEKHVPRFNPLSLNLAKKFGWSTSQLGMESCWQSKEQVRFSVSLRDYRWNKESRIRSLAVLLRVKDRSGKPVHFPYFQEQGEHLLRECRLNDESPATPSTNIPVVELAERSLEIEMEDGTGGWLPVNGPIFFDSVEGLAWAAISVFPRQKAELKLRFLHRQSSMECLIDNPAPITGALPDWQPDKFPATIVADDYQVQIEDQVGRRRPLDGWFEPYVYLKEKRSDLKRTLSCAWSLWDRSGNQLLPIRHGPRGDQCFLLPGETMARLVVEVWPNVESYSWRQNQVTWIAEGTWIDPASMPSLVLTDEGAKLGYADQIIVHPPDKPKLHHVSGLMPVLEVELKGKGSKSDWNRIHIHYEEGRIAFFSEGDRAFGSTESAASGHGNFGSSYFWSSRATWAVAPEAGMKVRIGLIKRRFPDRREFFLKVR
jgi:hypothetical protein